MLELFDCDVGVINSIECVKEILVEAARRARTTIVDVVFHEFNPHGVTGVIIIAESHISVHTWPEHRYAAVDAFTCGDNAMPEIAAQYIAEQFKAARSSIVDLPRGVFMHASS